MLSNVMTEPIENPTRMTRSGCPTNETEAVDESLGVLDAVGDGPTVAGVRRPSNRIAGRQHLLFDGVVDERLRDAVLHLGSQTTDEGPLKRAFVWWCTSRIWISAALDE